MGYISIETNVCLPGIKAHKAFYFLSFRTFDTQVTKPGLRIVPEVKRMEFQNGSVPIKVVARIYGKDATWVRAGIIAGWLPIGKATRNGSLITKVSDIDSRLGRINFYISPMLLYQETGYVWKGERE